TEAEWEYAARAGQPTIYAGGDDLDQVAWYGGNSDKQLHPVGTKIPNAWGLHDMTGNVWDWIWDWHGEYPAEVVTDPVGPDRGKVRIHRGGSFSGIPWRLRVAMRSGGPPRQRDGNLGFR